MRAKRYIFRYLRSRSLLIGFIVLTIYCWLQKIPPDKKSVIRIRPLKRHVKKTRSTSESEYFIFNISPKTSSTAYNNKLDIFIPTNLQKKDWHNYTQIEVDKLRIGLGEQGQAGKVSEEEYQRNPQLFTENGYNAVLSDKIAVDRALPDVRHPQCKNRTYIESLPTASVVIPFHNEHWTTLLRSIYSILNRSPKELIKEIFLVDDASTKEALKEELDEYIKKHMAPTVKVVRVANRTGLAGARLAGAQLATADVLVFLDSHIEVNVNWLPPLLEPIALSYKTAAAPFIDVIMLDTFKYDIQDGGMRGGFDWNLEYKRIPLLPQNIDNMPDNFESPVMAGGLFAISRVFFWELGGYDPGLRFWGGEQFELSFKIWQCGGRLVDVPCSHVGHVYRKFNPLLSEDQRRIIPVNFRRVIEVWMDEYKEYVYSRNPVFGQVDPGDLTDQKELRLRLKCKSFRWYMTQVAFDFMRYYPPKEPKPYAQGRIRPQGMTKLCVDAAHRLKDERVTLTRCRPDPEQSFILTFHKDIRLGMRPLCWDVPQSAGRGAVLLNCCHFSGGNQEWHYHQDTKLLEHNSKTCLDYDPFTLELFVEPCDESSETQRWIIDHVDKQRLDNWDKPVLSISNDNE